MEQPLHEQVRFGALIQRDDLCGGPQAAVTNGAAHHEDEQKQPRNGRAVFTSEHRPTSVLLRRSSRLIQPSVKATEIPLTASQASEAPAEDTLNEETLNQMLRNQALAAELPFARRT